MTVGSEHRPDKRISSTLQKQINKKILKEQTEPQTHTLIVKKNYVHESHPRGITLTYDNSWKCPNFNIQFWPFKPCNLKTMGAPDFSKNWTIVLNFHAKIINTLIPVCQQTTKKWYVKRSFSTNYIFTTQHDFQTCFDKKNAYLQLMTSIIYRLDIALAAPKKNRLIFLMSAKKGRETTN